MPNFLYATLAPVFTFANAPISAYKEASTPSSPMTPSPIPYASKPAEEFIVISPNLSLIKTTFKLPNIPPAK